jgi:hypothetical protein
MIRCCHSVALLILCALPLLASPNYSISNPDFDVFITSFGYSDVLLDKRPGFEGREFLSGEWAAAVCYTKNGVTNGPIWLEPEFIFPDWISNSYFSIEVAFRFANPVSPTNTHGFNVYELIITNDCLRITPTRSHFTPIALRPPGKWATLARRASIAMSHPNPALACTSRSKRMIWAHWRPAQMSLKMFCSPLRPRST